MIRLKVLLILIILLGSNFYIENSFATTNPKNAACKVAVRECQTIIEDPGLASEQLEDCKTCCTNTTLEVLGKRCTKRCIKACEKKFKSITN